MTAALEVLAQVEAALLQEAALQVSADLERWLGPLPGPHQPALRWPDEQDLSLIE